VLRSGAAGGGADRSKTSISFFVWSQLVVGLALVALALVGLEVTLFLLAAAFLY
jgi:hypothetical protein